MHLQVKKEKIVGELFLGFSDPKEYIAAIVNVYSSEIDREYWLTKTELDFFVCTCLHVLKGHPCPISEEAVQIYKKYFNPSVNKKNIWTYINKLCRKKWLVYDVITKQAKINPIVENIRLDNHMVDFKIRLVLENEDDR